MSERRGGDFIQVGGVKGNKTGMGERRGIDKS